ncbi:COG1470 family protein [Parapedobacter soli]|uniref:COG1470 family protein n=1 Tax=Parapedobacter soli TaxID=416955 RepID=UPI0021C794AF|nr:NEW3 domain-containing protein [Parapedobacter soli]
MLTRAITLPKVIVLLLVLCGVFPIPPLQHIAVAQSLSLYTPYTKISVPPGESIDYSVDVINNGGGIRNADLAVSGLPEGWSYELKSGGWTIEQLSVLPKEKKNISFKVQVPYKVEKGTYRFQLVAKGASSLPLTVVVSEQGTFKSEFNTDQANMEGAANSTFTFNATLRNPSSEEQVYGLRAQVPQGWNALFRANGKQVSSVKVDPNQTQNITVELDPPDQLGAGKYKIPVVASASGMSSNLELEVVITGSYNLELTTPSGRLNTSITAGSNEKVELLVKNTGSAALKNVEMKSSAPVDWTVEFQPAKIDVIAPGQHAQVVATIKASRKAVAGDYVTNLEARTVEKTATASLRVSVRTPLFWGWLGIMVIAGALGGVYYLFRKYGRR